MDGDVVTGHEALYPHARKCAIDSGWCSECGHSAKSHTPCLASTVIGPCGCKQFRSACDCGATALTEAHAAGRLSGLEEAAKLAGQHHQLMSREEILTGRRIARAIREAKAKEPHG